MNPHSAGGRAARIWPRVMKRLEQRLGSFEVLCTDANRGAAPLARELLRDGTDLIIAAGGDGTLNEVANGFFDGEDLLRPEARLAVLPLGRGSDFPRSLGIESLAHAIEVASTGVPLAIDVGKARFHAHDGSPQSRCFINLVSFGIGGEVARRARNLPIGGVNALGFLWAALRTAWTYRGCNVTITLDSMSQPTEYVVTNVAVGNGQYHGAGMRPCPSAVLNDGLFEVTVIDYLRPVAILRDVHMLYSSRIYEHPKVHHFQTRNLLAASDQPASIEVDGEPLGVLPLEITLLPRRIRVLAPAERSARLLTR